MSVDHQSVCGTRVIIDSDNKEQGRTFLSSIIRARLRIKTTDWTVSFRRIYPIYLLLFSIFPSEVQGEDGSIGQSRPKKKYDMRKNVRRSWTFLSFLTETLVCSQTRERTSTTSTTPTSQIDSPLRWRWGFFFVKSTASGLAQRVRGWNKQLVYMYTMMRERVNRRGMGGGVKERWRLIWKNGASKKSKNKRLDGNPIF